MGVIKIIFIIFLSCDHGSYLPLTISALTRLGSVKDKPRSGTFNPSRFAQPNGNIDQNGDLINSSVQGLKRVSLYVLGEKTQMKVYM